MRKSNAALFADEVPDGYLECSAFSDCCTCGHHKDLSFNLLNASTGPEATGKLDDGGATAVDIPGGTSTTTSINIGDSLSDTLEFAGDTDWIEVTLTAGESYLFTLNGTGGNALLDPFIEIRNSSGTKIAQDDDAGPGINSQLRFTAPTSGTYYLVARSYQDEDQQPTAGDYTLTADLGPAQNPLDAIDWGTQLSVSSVDVYFVPNNQSVAGYESDGWSQTQINGVMNVLATIANVTNLTFNRTFSTTGAEFRLVTYSEPGLEYAGQMGPPGTGNAGVGVFNVNSSTWTSGFNQGAGGFALVMHEILHGLGFAHPHDNGGASEVLQGVIDDFNSYGAFGLNQGVYTNITYNDGYPEGASVNRFYGQQGGPMALDIALLQQKYGANTTYNSGDNVYTLTNGNQVGQYFQSIWDTGGIDSIEFSGSQSATIDLREATLLHEEGGGGFISRAGSSAGGFTIANGVVIENARSGIGNDTLTGNNAANVLDGRGGSDSLFGGDGDDTLIGGADDDSLDGGDGFDFASYSDWSSGILVNLATGQPGDTFVSIEGIIGSDFNDTLTGDAGDNQFIGGLGADILDGDDGEDTASYAGSAAGVTVDLATGTGSGGEAAGDTLTNIERIIGSAFNDVLTGDAGANALFGGIGSDYLVGGGGADALDGGDGIDVADYGGSSAGVAIDLGAGTASGGDAAGDVLTSIERLSGSAQADSLFGDAGANILLGRAGADDLRGRAGADRLEGGDGYGLSAAGGSVLRLYEATLDRAPDIDGFLNWSAELGSGTALTTIAANFVNSIEFQSVYGALDDTAFVTLLYNNVLDRAPDQIGLDNWLNALSAGTSRAEVVVGFSDSAEFQNATTLDTVAFATNVLYGDAPGTVYRLYQATLDRAPDPAGFLNWVNAISYEGGLSSEDAAESFVDSAEFALVYGALDDTEFVTLLYNNVLDREPDEIGLMSWLDELDSGASRASVVLGFSQSQEFRTNSAAALESFMHSDLSGFDDSLAGGAGDDLLYGGFGADRFDFSAFEVGSDQVYGFDGFDALGFADFGYADQAEALAHFTQTGMDLLFSDQGVDIFFHNTTLAMVQNADFYLS